MQVEVEVRDLAGRGMAWRGRDHSLHHRFWVPDNFQSSQYAVEVFPWQNTGRSIKLSPLDIENKDMWNYCVLWCAAEMNAGTINLRSLLETPCVIA